MPTIRAITYEADFIYTEHGVTVIEDVKGVRTAVFNLKANLLERAIESLELRLHYPIRFDITDAKDV